MFTIVLYAHTFLAISSKYIVNIHQDIAIDTDFIRIHNVEKLLVYLEVNWNKIMSDLRNIILLHSVLFDPLTFSYSIVV